MTVKEMLQEYYELEILMELQELQEGLKKEFIKLKLLMGSEVLFPVLRGRFLEKKTQERIAEEMGVDARTVSRRQGVELKKLENLMNGRWRTGID